MHQVVVHAHCYQPPRENPWLEVVESEPSAAPDHDWNTRIDRECYARLASAQVRVRDAEHPHDPDAREGLARLINLYAWCTFDVGATLCEWLETESPATLQAMRDGDAASVKRWGHGNAIAAPYHHVILPLASPRDRQTEVRWGLADFRKRFGREPEGFWLPECAADDDTLELLAAEGIRFTILAPYQVKTTGETHGLPVQWHGSGGRSLAILPYDGSLAGEVAFGGLLQNASALARRLAPSLNDGQPRCTTLATDGETFGHHHRGGDRTLAEALALVAARPDAMISNAARVVATNPATVRAQLVSPSSWSCAHGVERWRANCSCRINHDKAPAQHWRGPLREALQYVEQLASTVFETEGAPLFRDTPWHARDQYGESVATDGEQLATGAANLVHSALTPAQHQRAQELLEMQRAALRMYTSCAWFFDEVDRIETRQVLRYAARVLELAHSSSDQHTTFLKRLARAHAATPQSPTAADAFVRSVAPPERHAERVAAGAFALSAHAIPCRRIAVYDVIESSTRSTVTLCHRRTGATQTYGGMVHGHGPTMTVTIHQTPLPLDKGHTYSMSDLPQSVAVQLLRLWVLDDQALLRPNSNQTAVP